MGLVFKSTILAKECSTDYNYYVLRVCFILFGEYFHILSFLNAFKLRAGILIGVGNILILFKYKEKFCEFRFIAKIFS